MPHTVNPVPDLMGKTTVNMLVHALIIGHTFISGLVRVREIGKLSKFCVWIWVPSLRYFFTCMQI